MTDIYTKYKIDLPLKPVVLLCGDIEDVKKCYVLVNDFKYSFDSLVCAVEFCFKSFKAFQLDFPDTCKHVWVFLQKRPYKVVLEKGLTLSCVDELVRKLDFALKPKKK